MSSTRQSFTIKSGDTDSNEISVEERSFFILETSLLLTGTSFAILHKRKRDGTFGPLKDDTGTDIAITVGPDQQIALVSEAVAKAMAGARKIKFRGTAQAADRDLSLTME